MPIILKYIIFVLVQYVHKVWGHMVNCEDQVGQNTNFINFINFICEKYWAPSSRPWLIYSIYTTAFLKSPLGSQLSDQEICELITGRFTAAISPKNDVIRDHIFYSTKCQVQKSSDQLAKWNNCAAVSVRRNLTCTLVKAKAKSEVIPGCSCWFCIYRDDRRTFLTFLATYDARNQN